jgi:hypothetical protein
MLWFIGTSHLRRGRCAHRTSRACLSVVAIDHNAPPLCEDPHCLLPASHTFPTLAVKTQLMVSFADFNINLELDSDSFAAINTMA